MEQRDPQVVFRETRYECLKATAYEKPLGIEIVSKLKRAMLYTSMMNLGLEFDTYKRLIILTEGFNLFEIEYILKILLAATPDELGQSAIENLNFLQEFLIPLRDSFCEVDDVISNKVAREINAKMRISEGVPANKKLFIPNRQLVGI